MSKGSPGGREGIPDSRGKESVKFYFKIVTLL